DGLPKRFAAALAERCRVLRRRAPDPAGVDPAVAFTAVYMQFSNYFIVERMIGARGHMGLTDGEAVETLATIYRQGLAGLFGAASPGDRRKDGAPPVAPPQEQGSDR
ncbi:hypothetical protein ACFL59_11685, partial [Planctomycetota bacterium]